VLFGQKKHARMSQNHLNEPVERCAGLSSSLLVTETRAKLLTLSDPLSLSEDVSLSDIIFDIRDI
jgi:hypothetical protein